MSKLASPSGVHHRLAQLHETLRLLAHLETYLERLSFPGTGHGQDDIGELRDGIGGEIGVEVKVLSPQCLPRAL